MITVELSTTSFITSGPDCHSDKHFMNASPDNHTFYLSTEKSVQKFWTFTVSIPLIFTQNPILWTLTEGYLFKTPSKCFQEKYHQNEPVHETLVLSHMQAAKTKTSRHISAGLSEPLLHAYIYFRK